MEIKHRMDKLNVRAQSAIVVDEDWDQALEQALEQLEDIRADVLFLFASGEYAAYFPAMIRRARERMGMPILIGCSSQGVIGMDQELEDLPAVSLLALTLPGVRLYPVHLTAQLLEECQNPQEWRDRTGVALDDVHAWLLFTDPLQSDIEQLIEGLANAYPSLPIIGGLASGNSGLEYRQAYQEIDYQQTSTFLNDEVFDSGSVALGIGGAYTLVPLVSQGCEPLGESWTITSVLEDGLIDGISNRTAYEMLKETFRSVPVQEQRRVQRNLQVGLAANEYQDKFRRGSFLIRQLCGINRKTGGLAITAMPRVGQTIQFQVRDAASADQDLHAMLRQARQQLEDNMPIAALVCTCNGRGVGMFGVPDHDASAIMREFGPLPLAGLFCNGEIGPVDNKAFLHNFSVCLALLTRYMEKSEG
jgi:small ligand-binding sensory domain FIST